VPIHLADRLALFGLDQPFDLRHAFPAVSSSVSIRQDV
jgi:hypothetical protein